MKTRDIYRDVNVAAHRREGFAALAFEQGTEEKGICARDAGAGPAMEALQNQVAKELKRKMNARKRN